MPTLTDTPRRHRVDLIAQQTLCQANYARLLKILPFLDQQDHCAFSVPYQDRSAQLSFTRVEKTRYTQLLSIEIDTSWSQLITTPTMRVRIYHDAQLAEVVSAGSQRHLAAHYAYPNAQMFQPNEKHQLNCFLADWLSYCLHDGRSAIAL